MIKSLRKYGNSMAEAITIRFKGLLGIELGSRFEPPSAEQSGRGS